MLGNFGFFGIALLIGGIPLALKSHLRIRLHQRAQHWPKVRATIVRSSVAVSTDCDGTSLRPVFSYRCAGAGIGYSSTRHTEDLPFPAPKKPHARWRNAFLWEVVSRSRFVPPSRHVRFSIRGFPRCGISCVAQASSRSLPAPRLHCTKSSIRNELRPLPEVPDKGFARTGHISTGMDRRLIRQVFAEGPPQNLTRFSTAT